MNRDPYYANTSDSIFEIMLDNSPEMLAFYAEREPDPDDEFRFIAQALIAMGDD